MVDHSVNFGPSDIFLLGDAVVCEWPDIVGCEAVARIEKLMQDQYSVVEMFFLDASNFCFDSEERKKSYRDAMCKFSIVHLGRNQTKVLLEAIGISCVSEPLKSNLETLRNNWLDENSEDRSNTDASLVHKTVCAFDMNGESKVVASGSPLDVPIVFEFCTIEHPRASDAEFQIVNILAAKSGLRAATLSVSEIPCISCLGALAQFRLRFPDVSLAMDFDLRKVPGTPLAAAELDAEIGDLPPLLSSGSRTIMVKPPTAKDLATPALDGVEKSASFEPESITTVRPGIDENASRNAPGPKQCDKKLEFSVSTDARLEVEARPRNLLVPLTCDIPSEINGKHADFAASLCEKDAPCVALACDISERNGQHTNFAASLREKDAVCVPLACVIPVSTDPDPERNGKHPEAAISREETACRTPDPASTPEFLLPAAVRTAPRRSGELAIPANPVTRLERGFYPLKWSAPMQQTFYPVPSPSVLTFGLSNAEHFAPRTKPKRTDARNTNFRSFYSY